MRRVVGIDHLVLSVSDFVRSKDFYGKVLGFLGFGRKNRFPLFPKMLHAFELSNRKDVDALGACTAWR